MLGDAALVDVGPGALRVGTSCTKSVRLGAAWHLFDNDVLRARFVAGSESEQVATQEEILRLEPGGAAEDGGFLHELRRRQPPLPGRAGRDGRDPDLPGPADAAARPEAPAQAGPDLVRRADEL